MGRVCRWWFIAALLALQAGGVPAAAREDVGPETAGPEVAGAVEAEAAAVPAPAPNPTEPRRVSMEFQEASLKDVLKSFSQETGINVIAAGDVADEPITLYFDGVTAMDALDQILRAGNFTYERPHGSEIYIVRPRDAAAPATITRVYQLRYARVSKSVLAKAAATFGSRTPFEGALAGNGEQGGGGTVSLGAGLGGGADVGEGVGIDVVLEGLLTDQGGVIVDPRTNRLIVTDVPVNFPRIEAALAALDIRTPQILVDAEIVETTLSKLKDLGVEWGTGTEGTLSVFTPGVRTTTAPWSWLDSDLPVASTTLGLTQGPGTLDDPVSHSGVLSVGLVDTSHMQAVLQALEQDSETKILARPKILTLDNESAIIRLTTQEAIGFESTVGEIQSTSEPERTTTGVVLVVTPQVNESGYITMLVEPSVAKTVASKITPPTGQASTRDPKTRSSRTLVRIRDGDTLVVGGLIDRSEIDTERRVPILAGIPLVGEAFKNVEKDHSATELIVFVTPRILDEPSAAQLAATGQSPLGLREQEPRGSRQEAIEETLNEFEQPRM